MYMLMSVNLPVFSYLLIMSKTMARSSSAISLNVPPSIRLAVDAAVPLKVSPFDIS